MPPGAAGRAPWFEAPGDPEEVPLDDGPHGPAAGQSPAELLMIAVEPDA